ncbi:MAG: PAS domain S-box protein [Candidatus Saliniplasma sp.]
MKILLVDDERTLLKQAKIFLEREDVKFDVDAAVSVDEALKMIEVGDYDVIVSDYKMPKTDGLEFLKVIREERGSDIPFIMFTGRGREEVAISALNLGVDRYISKIGEPETQYGLLADAIKQEIRHHTVMEEKESHMKELKFMNDVMTEVNKMKHPDKICEYVAEKIYSLNRDDYVTVSFYNPERDNILKTLSAGFDEYQQKSGDISLSDNGTITFDADEKDAWLDIFRSENLELMPDGMYILLNRFSSREETREIKDMLGIEEIYSVGFHIGDTQYGGICLFKKQKGAPKFKSAIESVAGHLSAVFQRRHSEERMRKSREEIKESEEKYRLLFETTPHGVVYQDKDGEITSANPAAEEILGLSIEQMQGRLSVDSIWKAIHEDGSEFPGDEHPSMAALRNGKEVKDQIIGVYNPKKGRYIWIKINAVPLFKDGEQEPYRVYTTFEDITERKKVEEKLRESEKRFDLALEGTKAGLWDWNIQTGELVVDERWAEIAGYKLEELEPVTFETWENLAHPEDLKKSRGLMEKHFNGETEIYEFKGRMKHKDGHWVWVMARGKVTEWVDKGDPLRMVGTRIDITRMEQAEAKIKKNKEKLEKLHKASAKLETCQSEDEVFDLAVKAAEDILELDMCTIMVPDDGKMVNKKVSKNYPDDEDHLIIEQSAAGKAFLENESFLTDDIEKDELTSPTREEYRSGITVPIESFGVFQAVSSNVSNFDGDDLKIVELLMGHVSESLKRVEIKKREDFLYSLLRHDVENKIQVVKGYLRLLEDKGLSDEEKDFIRNAVRACDEGSNLITKVRTLSRLSDAEKEELNLRLVLNEVLDEYEPRASDKGIKITFQGCNCSVDSSLLLKELFSNLLENSIQHSGCEKIRINFEETDDLCIVRVEDDGKGLSDEEKEKVFEKGYKKGPSAGSGLGMYLVKEIADRYGAGVEVKDSELGGVRFDVYLKKVS